MIRMPGTSWSGSLPPLTEEQATLRDALRDDVVMLADTIGARSIRSAPKGLKRAEDWLAETLASTAGVAVERQVFEAEGVACANLIAEFPGTTRADEIVVIGAHYDTCMDTPGADDNASGVAGALALARARAGVTAARTIRIVLFVNEEPPYFQTGRMGSLRYATRCRERRDDVVAMISLEMLGSYRDEEGSQSYPPPLSWFYPTRGDFIAFVGNFGSRRLVRDSIRSFREHARFPSEGAAPPGWLPGVGWSDHWAFWQAGYRAIMVTDTAMYRYPHYHTPNDTPDQLDYERMARVVEGLGAVLESLSNE
ncbi:MAG: M28 family peptidase [Planctomycetes bacterium]|nr:M28 family peptidase [Planctomycetota bacterium]